MPLQPHKPTGGLTVGSIGSLTGLTPKAVYLGNAPSGISDLYTCPAGKRAYISFGTVYNTNGSAVTGELKWKISGSYYNLSDVGASFGATSIANLSVAKGLGVVLEAGESISINLSNTGCNVALQVYEFSNTSNFKTVRVINPATANTTVYTCPTGKSASLSLSQMNNASGSQLAAIWPVVGYSNTAGSSVTATIHYVPSAGSVSSATQVSSSTSVTNNTVVSFFVGINLNAGDSIVINTSTQTATQLAWINVFEI